MGVDLGTYRGRIGTFKFAFGTDVVTVNCYINFSHGLKTISVVTFISVLFLLASTEIWSIQKEHASAILVSISQQPGSVWFTDMLLLMAGIEPNPGPVLSDKSFSMLIVVVVSFAMIFVMTGTDTSPSTKLFSVFVILVIIAAIHIQGSMDDTATLDGNLKEGSISTRQRMNAEDEMTSKPAKELENTSGEQLPYETKHGRKDNETEKAGNLKDQGSVLTRQRMNAEDEMTSNTAKEFENTSCEQLPYKTKHGSKDNENEISGNLKDQGSVLTRQRMNAEDEMTSKPAKEFENTSGEKLPYETKHGRKDNETEIAKNLSDQDSVSTSQRMDVKDKKTSGPMKLLNKFLKIIKRDKNKKDKGSVSTSQRKIVEENVSQPLKVEMVNADEQLPYEAKHGNETGSINKDIEGARTRLNVVPVVSQSTTVACDSSTGSQNKDNEGARTRLKVAPVASLSVACDSSTGSQNKDNKGAQTRLNVAPVVSQSTTAACDSSTDFLEEEKETFKSLFRLLGLEPFIQSEITVNDILMTDPANHTEENNNSFKDLPWLFLKQLLAGNSDAFDLRIYNLETNTITDTSDVLEGTVLAMSETSNESDTVSPLDLLLVVFQCCSPELRQLLFQKLYLCKKAIPFIYKSRFSQQPVMSLLALYSIVIANKIKTPSGKYTTMEYEVIDMPTKLVSFARFGRPQFSKSKLLNGILCDYAMDIFFHKDCQSGMVSRHLTGEYIEMFWLPKIGQTENRFDNPMTFLNVRGDIDTALEIRSLIANISDVFTVFIDKTSLLGNSEKLSNILNRFRFVLLIIASPLDLKDVKTRNSLFDFESSFKESKTKIKILCTFNGNREKHPVDFSLEVTRHILNHLKERDLSGRPLREYLTNEISTDESECSKAAEAHAKYIVKSMRGASSQEDMAGKITPIQFQCSTELGKILRNLFLNKDADLNQKYKEKIKSLRYEQLSKITNSVKLFMKSLEKCSQMPHALYFLLGWLKLYLGQNKREVLSRLMKENQLLWKKYRNMKKDGKPSSLDLDDKERSIKQSESRIENASFGIEHLLREVGHIYDAVILLKLNPKQFDIPEIETVANIFATLVLDGHTFELLDGNSFYMPSEWIKLVLGIVNARIDNKRVLALSVLGLQSSGKSTLLNTMFGLQFASSAGRCTRGIHSQLIPMKKQRDQIGEPLFEYVLVIDTEGLRAPELSDRNYSRDNELATIITGLGDITILNIMGENTSEIRDILQIIVHAFLRLKLTNRRLDIRKSCILIHQNVADISAAEKNKTGLELTVRNLDTVARESAESEGISDITTFNQIIEFNTDRSVWYLPNLWKGNPPMAQMNPKYSENVVSINHDLIDRALKDQSKSFKSLDDIVTHTDELWKGVLAEDFVFSFKNSIEKKAYVALDKTRKEKLQKLEGKIDTEVFKLSQNVFSECKTQNELAKAKQTVVVQMKILISQMEQEAISELEKYFSKNEYTDITIQWKESSLNLLREMCVEISQRKLVDIDRVQDKRAFDILTTSSYGAQEEEFRKKSIELANLIKGKGMKDKEIDERFEAIWNSFVHFALKEENLPIPVSSLKPKFIDCLSNCFRNHPVLTRILEQYEMYQKPPQTNVLSGSFKLTTITKDDISIKSKAGELFSKNNIAKLFDDSFKIVMDRLEFFFKNVDQEVEQMCLRDIEITDNNVRSFIWKIESSLAAFVENYSDNFTLIISFNFKVLVHVCYIACHRFEEHNTEYQKLHGLQVRLAKYKSQCRERFLSHLDERNAESTAAVLFRHAVSNFVLETIKDGMSDKVKNALKCKQLPKRKHDLITTMLTEMLNIGDFKTFVYYIQSSKSYATQWITTEANKYLFSTISRQYFEIASTDTKVCLDDIKQGILTTTDHFRNSPISIAKWLQYFVNTLKLYTIPIQDLREVQRELGDSKNIDAGNLKSMLLNEIEPIESSLLKTFEIETETSVRWRGSNPYENVITDIWGCPEQCVFCGEPCAESSLHPQSNHKCLQHRPAGCNGVCEENSNKIWLTTCNYDVTQSYNPQCSYFGFVCNPGKKEACSAGRHKLSEYYKIIPRWEIKGSPDSEERSTFWLWFVGRYKKELGDYYNGIDVSNVPSSWSKFTNSEAIESLRKTYPE